jgi:hypothetical protein
MVWDWDPETGISFFGFWDWDGDQQRKQWDWNQDQKWEFDCKICKILHKLTLFLLEFYITKNIKTNNFEQLPLCTSTLTSHLQLAIMITDLGVLMNSPLFQFFLLHTYHFQLT